MTVVQGTGLPNQASQQISVDFAGNVLISNTCGLPIPAGTYTAGTLSVGYTTSCSSQIVNPGGVSVSVAITLGTGPVETLTTAEAVGTYNKMYTLNSSDMTAVNAAAGTSMAGVLATGYYLTSGAWS